MVGGTTSGAASSIAPCSPSASQARLQAAALRRGARPRLHRGDLVFDGPISLANGSLPVWSPRNYKERYYGSTTLRNALAKSLNTVTVRVATSIGMSPLMELLKRFRIFNHMPRGISRLPSAAQS